MWRETRECGLPVPSTFHTLSHRWWLMERTERSFGSVLFSSLLLGICPHQTMVWCARVPARSLVLKTSLWDENCWWLFGQVCLILLGTPTYTAFTVVDKIISFPLTFFICAGFKFRLENIYFIGSSHRSLSRLVFLKMMPKDRCVCFCQQCGRPNNCGRRF